MRLFAGIPLGGEPAVAVAWVTLARVRQPGGLRLDQLAADRAAVPGAMPVDAITLYESRLLPGGPRYVPLRQARLRAS